MARAISKILFILGSYNFLASLECVRSYAWSKGHSDPDLSSVLCFLQTISFCCKCPNHISLNSKKKWHMIFGQNLKILDIVKLRLLFCHCAKLEELLPTLADIYFLFNKLSGSEKARSLVKNQHIHRKPGYFFNSTNVVGSSHCYSIRSNL